MPEEKKLENQCKGIRQIKAIILEIMYLQDYPRFDFINGVLSCKELFGEYELWLHWGDIRIVPIKRKYEKGLKAGDLDILEDWKNIDDKLVFNPKQESLADLFK
jgi:hypothetical protein